MIRCNNLYRAPTAKMKCKGFERRCIPQFSKISYGHKQLTNTHFNKLQEWSACQTHGRKSTIAITAK